MSRKPQAGHVIHTVGPVYSRGKTPYVFGTPQLLASAYQKSLEVANENGIQSISFPSISTGAYGYPVNEAAPIALSTVIGYIKIHPEVKMVRFVLFDKRTLEVYEAALQDLSVS